MKRFVLIAIIHASFGLGFAQTQTIKLSPSQIEVLFIKQNLSLIAEKMNIDIADAEIAQAKLWENPNLSIDDLNFWSSEGQRNGEEIPPLFGSFGRNMEFSAELSQLIPMGGKIKKLVEREKVSKEITIQQFEEVLRELKTNLRKSVQEIIYSQSYYNVLKNQHESFTKLIEGYKNQVAQGNLPKNELLRLQSGLLELENEMNEEQITLNEQMRVLKSLLHADPFVSIEIVTIEPETKDPNDLSLQHLFDLMKENRPDMKISNLQTQYFEKALSYEKSQRIPDLTLSASYDRWGGVWRDYVGVGISMDLPLLNRNRGNIRAAVLGRDQSQYVAKQQENEAQQELVEAYNNYAISYKFYKKIVADNLLSELDQMLDVYTKNLLKRNISIVEYTDFMEAYKSNKQTILNARKNRYIKFEELQNIVGTDIK